MVSPEGGGQRAGVGVAMGRWCKAFIWLEKVCHPLQASSLGNPGDALRPSDTEMVFNGQEQRLLEELTSPAPPFRFRGLEDPTGRRLVQV